MPGWAKNKGEEDHEGEEDAEEQDEEQPECFGEYDDQDKECEDCEQSEQCAASTPDQEGEEATQIKPKIRDYIYTMLDDGNDAKTIKKKLSSEFGIELGQNQINAMIGQWNKAKTRGKWNPKVRNPSPAMEQVAGPAPAYYRTPPPPPQSDDILQLIRERDPVARYYRLYNDAKAKGDNNLAALMWIKLEKAMDDAPDPAQQNAKKSGGDSEFKDELLKIVFKQAIDNIKNPAGQQSEGVAIAQAITGSIDKAVERGTATLQEIAGRKKLTPGGLASNPPVKYEYTCSGCKGTLASADVSFCPHCGLKLKASPAASAQEEPEDDEKCPSYGNYDAEDAACRECTAAFECREASNEPELVKEAPKAAPAAIVAKPIEGPTVDESTFEYLDTLHRIGEWVQKGDDPKDRISFLYKAAVNRKTKRISKKNREHIMQALFLSRLVDVVGLEELTGIAKKYRDDPALNEYFVTEHGYNEEDGRPMDILTGVMNTPQYKNWVRSAFDELKLLAGEDGLTLTTQQAELYTEQANRFLDRKVTVDELFPKLLEAEIEQMSEDAEEEDEPPAKKERPRPEAPAPVLRHCPFCKFTTLNYDALTEHMHSYHKNGQNIQKKVK